MQIVLLLREGHCPYKVNKAPYPKHSTRRVHQWHGSPTSVPNDIPLRDRILQYNSITLAPNLGPLPNIALFNISVCYLPDPLSLAFSDLSQLPGPRGKRPRSPTDDFTQMKHPRLFSQVTVLNLRYPQRQHPRLCKLGHCLYLCITSIVPTPLYQSYNAPSSLEVDLSRLDRTLGLTIQTLFLSPSQPSKNSVNISAIFHVDASG